MKTVKMSLANIQGKMSRKEMKEIIAGRMADGSITIVCGNQTSLKCSCSGDCSCKGYDLYYTKCTDNSTGSDVCYRWCPDQA